MVVGEICWWLDGILLVIEFVVVWVWLMLLFEIVDGLDDCFWLLVGGVWGVV